MTPAQPPAPPASPNTVADALVDVGRIGSYFSVGVGAGDGSWQAVAEGYAEGLAPLVEHHADYLGVSERRVAASIAQLGHAARLWSPVLACALLHGVVPDLRGLRRRPRGTELLLPSTTGFLAPRGDACARLVYDVVVKDHLQPLAAGLRVKLAPGLLNGNASSALAGSAQLLLRERPDVREPLTRLTADLLKIGDLRDTGHLTGPDLTFRRRSCCLYYRVPGGGLCGDCPLPHHP
ncbi:MAG: iron reductase [Streptosporangiales bacterium]|nr:iron reductase [Streptosporangiales bacterium]